MGEEVKTTPAPIALMTYDSEGKLVIEIRGFDSLLLFGFAELVRERAREIHFQQATMIANKKPRLVVP
jgi:hypothetical protein